MERGNPTVNPWGGIDDNGRAARCTADATVRHQTRGALAAAAFPVLDCRGRNLNDDEAPDLVMSDCPRAIFGTSPNVGTPDRNPELRREEDYFQSG